MQYSSLPTGAAPETPAHEQLGQVGEDVSTNGRVFWDEAYRPELEWVHSIGGVIIPNQAFEQGNAKSKTPLWKGWPEKEAGLEVKHSITFLGYGHSISLVLPNDILVVDVDAPSGGTSGHKVDGREAFRRLVIDTGLQIDLAPCVHTGPHGRHLYFRKPADVRLKTKLKQYPGIDFKSQVGYVVIPPSPHWLGQGRYRLSDASRSALPELQIPDAPDELIELLRRDSGETASRSELTLQGISGDHVADLLEVLDPEDYRGEGGGRWVELMMAVHSATNGSEEGFQVFDQWCKQDPLYASHDIRKRWESCQVGGGITVGTLIKHCRDHAAGISEPQERKDSEARIKRIIALLQFQDVIVPDASIRPIEIILSHDEKAVAENAAKCLGRIDGVYVRGNVLVEVYVQRAAAIWRKSQRDDLQVRELPKEQLRSEISSRCRFFEVKSGKGGDPERVPKKTPKEVVDHINTMAEYPNVPVLERIATCPTLLPDGTLLQTEGFHEPSGVLYAPNDDFPESPESPTRDDAYQGIMTLWEVFRDFPFVDAHHSIIPIAVVLTMLARDSYEGPAPAMLIDGNTKGVGKSLLARVIHLIATGTDIAASSSPENDAEMRKRLTAVACNAAPGILVDNVPNAKAFGFPSLDAFLTATHWEDRLLTTSKLTGKLRIASQTFITGNNIRLPDDSDLARRVLYCRLDWKHESPENRNNFTHGIDEELLAYVSANRGELVKAALTILLAYRRHGSPPLEIPSWGTFSAWSAAVRNPLVWAGAADPYQSRHLMNQFVDESAELLPRLLGAIEQVMGFEAFTATDIRERIHHHADRSVDPLRQILEEKLDDRQRQSAGSLGAFLGKYLGRSASGKRLERCNCKRRNTTGWRIVKV